MPTMHSPAWWHPLACAVGHHRQWPQCRGSRKGLGVDETADADLDELALLVPDGALLALPPDNSLAALRVGAGLWYAAAHVTCGCWGFPCRVW